MQSLKKADRSWYVKKSPYLHSHHTYEQLQAYKLGLLGFLKLSVESEIYATTNKKQIVYYLKKKLSEIENLFGK
jgi:hypothetical protein